MLSVPWPWLFSDFGFGSLFRALVGQKQKIGESGTSANVNGILVITRVIQKIPLMIAIRFASRHAIPFSVAKKQNRRSFLFKL